MVTGKRQVYPGDPQSPEVETGVEMVASRFNSKSDKKITVQRGTQEQKFEVQSK